MPTLLPTSLAACMVCLSLNLSVLAQERSCVFYLNFESEQAQHVYEHKSKTWLEFVGTKTLTLGTVNKGISFDGFTNEIVIPTGKIPDLSKAFTLSCWVALASYPWQWVPLFEENPTGTAQGDAGFKLGINGGGQLQFEVATNKQFNKCLSLTPISLRKWHYVCATFSEKEGLRVYLDGKPTGNTSSLGGFTPAPAASASIGRSANGPCRPDVLDGSFDELKIYNKAFSADKIAESYQKQWDRPRLSDRELPTMPKQTGFMVQETMLAFYHEWDSLRNASGENDFVVHFNELPYKLVFWQGTNFIPFWVDSANNWYSFGAIMPAHDWLEIGEVMHDAQVLVSEVSKARICIDLSYKLQQLSGHIPVQERYYIYPDASIVRSITCADHFASDAAATQIITLTPPYSVPDSIFKASPLQLLQYDLNYKDLSWPLEQPNTPSEAIAINFNTQNTLNPYLLPYNSHLQIVPQASNTQRSAYPVYNHWPAKYNYLDISPANTGGRVGFAPMAIGLLGKPNAKLLFMGLSQHNSLSDIAKAWQHPLEPVVMVAQEFRYNGFVPEQRAYEFACNWRPIKLQVQFLATQAQPLANPVFLLKNWDSPNIPQVFVGQQELQIGTAWNYHRIPNTTDLLIWTRVQKHQTVEITIKALKP